jgi:hypothetical protein
MEKIPDPESGMNIPDHFSGSFETVLMLKMLKFFDVDPDPGYGVFLTLDPGFGLEKFRSGINIPDPQHWYG